MIKKKVSLFILSLVFVFALAMFGMASLGFAKAEPATPVFQMIDGANVAATSNNKYEGLRFGAKVDADTVSAVNADANKCFGALIIPNDWFTTYEVSATAGTDYIKAFEEKDTIIEVSKYQREGLIVSADGNLYAGISNLYYANINRDYFGIMYIKTVNGSEVNYEYATFTADENVRNAAEVATIGLEVPEIEAEEKALLTKYVKKGAILDATPDITKENFELAYEAYDFNELVSSIDATDMFDGEKLIKAEDEYANLSNNAKAYVATTYASLLEAKEEYATKYVMATDISKVSIADEFDKGTSGTYENSISIQASNDDSIYGTTQVLKVDLTGCTNSHVWFKINAFSAVAEIVAENPGSTIEFYVKDNATSHTWWFGTANKAYEHTDYSGSDFAGKSVTTAGENQWTKVTFTADEVAALNGNVSVTWKSSISSIEISNIYVIKYDTSALVEAINALPEVADVKITTGEAIARADELVTEVEALGVIVDSTLKTKFNNVKAAYDAKWVMVTDIATEQIVVADTDGSKYSASGYNGKINTTTRVDDTYGTVQVVNITSVNGNHAFDINFVDALKTAVAGNAGSTVEFYVRGNACDNKWMLGNTSQKFITSTPQDENRVLITVATSTTGDNWVKVALTADQVNALNGIVSTAYRGAITYVEISNIYVVKEQQVVIPDKLDIDFSNTDNHFTNPSTSATYTAPYEVTVEMNDSTYTSGYLRATVTPASSTNDRAMFRFNGMYTAIKNAVDEYGLKITGVTLVMRSSIGSGREWYFQKEVAPHHTKTVGNDWTEVVLTTSEIASWTGGLYYQGSSGTINKVHTVDIAEIRLNKA